MQDIISEQLRKYPWMLKIKIQFWTTAASYFSRILRLEASRFHKIWGIGLIGRQDLFGFCLSAHTIIYWLVVSTPFEKY